MSSLPLHVTPLAARRFQRRALLLDHPVADVGAALAHHGYVQIDPLNVSGRMHDLILRRRVTAHREGDFMRHLHGDYAPLPAARRVAFEHHVPATGILVAFPLEAWPHLRAAMRARTRRASAWSGRLTAAERRLVPRLLDAIGERGPLGSEAFADTPRAPQFWGQATLAKSTLKNSSFMAGCSSPHATATAASTTCPSASCPPISCTRRPPPPPPPPVGKSSSNSANAASSPSPAPNSATSKIRCTP